MSDTLQQWFQHNGWSPFPFQHAVWEALRNGDSGLLHASTGAGKTLAVWGGILDAAPMPVADPVTIATCPVAATWFLPAVYRLREILTRRRALANPRPLGGRGLVGAPSSTPRFGNFVDFRREGCGFSREGCPRFGSFRPANHRN